ncbi:MULTISPECIES: ABC transporter permease [Bacillus]|uniref:ABC transporter permease n=1 Tax=Bacillus TaxID=1386 RepID=UPI00031AC844|nr:MULTISPECIES: ABC transporter permease [Bacillus]
MRQAFLATFQRDFIVLRRAYPWSFFIGHILSGVYIIIFAFLTYHFVFKKSLDSKFSISAGTEDYLSYVVLGGMLFSFSVSLLMIVSRAIITELREGTLESLLLTPSSRNGYFLGTLSQGMIRVLLEFSAIAVVGFLFGLHIKQVNYSSFCISLFVLIISTYAQALVLGTLMLYFRDTYLTQNTLFAVMGLVCSVTFPAEYLPHWAMLISHIMPLTYGVDAIRMSWIDGANLADITIQLRSMMLLAIIYFPIGSFFIKRMEKVVLEKHFG